MGTDGVESARSEAHARLAHGRFFQSKTSRRREKLLEGIQEE